MRTFAVLFTLILGMACSATAQGGPPKQPAKPLDPKDARSVAEHLVFNTRSQTSYKVTFKAKVSPPQGDPIEYEGICVWVKPGILFIHYTASGGDEKNIIRVGERAWVHHPFAGWTPDKEAGLAGAGRGIQNPDEVLDVLAKNLKGAKLDAPGVIALDFKGNDLQKVMSQSGPSDSFDWKQSSGWVRLSADEGTRLKKFACHGDLKSRAAGGGTVVYDGEVTVESYNKVTDYTFLDDSEKPIKLSEPIRKSMEKLRKEQN